MKHVKNEFDVAQLEQIHIADHKAGAAHSSRGCLFGTAHSVKPQHVPELRAVETLPKTGRKSH